MISQQETDKPTDEITEGTMSSYGSLILLILILLFVILLTAWNYLSFRKRKRPPSEEIRKEKKKKDGFSPAPAAARPVVEVKPPSAEIQDQDQPPSAVKTNIANQTNIKNRPPTAE